MRTGVKGMLIAGAAIFLLWWIFGPNWGQGSAQSEELTLYTIEKGEQNFSPLEPVFPGLNKKFTVAFRFDTSAYYHLDDWGGDTDWYDTNKLKGVTNFWPPWRRNYHSAMIGWRPSFRRGHFLVYPYTNFKDGKFKLGKFTEVPAGETFTATIDWRNDKIFYEVNGPETTKKDTVALSDPWLVSEVGTWFGGANNDPAKLPYGGRAHKKMKLWADIW